MTGALAPNRRARNAIALLALALGLSPVASAPAASAAGFSPLAGNPLAAPAGQSPVAPARTPVLKADKERPRAEAAPGTVLVRFRAGAGAADRADALAGAAVRSAGAVPGTRFVRAATGETRASDAARALEADPAVAEAVPDYKRRAAAAPNDPQYVKGQQGDLDVFRLPAAWDRAKATKEHVVAVLDTGVDLDHPDLEPQLVPGRDVVHGDDRAGDDNGHGTAVAGVVAARAGDGVGVAGVAWGAGLMPVKVLDDDGEGFDSDVATGIAWAVDHGADVVALPLSAYDPSPVLDDAVASARARGAVVVAATGNGGSNRRTYPAASPGAIATGATDLSGDLAYFSNYGDSVDVAAPGLGLTVPFRSAGDPEWRAESWEGTSLATGYVAGTALLVRAQNPSWTPAQVEARLLETSQDAGPPGQDPFYGRGVVDPLAAVGGPRRPAVTSTVDADSTRATATPIGPGEHAGMLVGEGDEDWYAYDVAQPGELFMDLWLNEYGDGGRLLDAMIDVYDASGVFIAGADGGYANEGEDLSADVPAGRVYIRISNYSGSSVPGTYGFYLESGPGGEAPGRYDKAWMLTSDDPVSVAVADLTGDGRQEVLATQLNLDPSPSGRYDQLLIHPFDPEGELGEPTAYDLGARSGDGYETLWNSEMDVDTGDVDADGRTDVIVAVGRWIGVLRQRAGGGLAPVEPVPGSRGADQVVPVDLDRDGRLDLVGRLDGVDEAGDRLTGLVAYMRTADGGYEATPIADGDFTDVEVADVNGDGRRDVVGLTYSSLVVARQAADGGWRVAAPLAEPGPMRLEVADVSGDGRADVVTATATQSYPPEEGVLRVRRQTSTGTLGAPSDIPISASVASLETGRVDGDQRLDLLLGRNHFTDLGVALQRPDGTLAGEDELHMVGGPPDEADWRDALVVTDLTGDGLADLVAATEVGVEVARQPGAGWPLPYWLRGASPANGARGVAATTSLRLELNRDLAPASVTAAAVRLVRGDTGAAVAASPSYDAATRTLTVKPNAALAPGAPYRLTLPGIRDTRGAAPADVALRFAVAGGVADTTAPDTRFTTAPTGRQPGGAVWFAAYATEPGTRTQCSLDGAAFADCHPPLLPEPAADGAHTFRVRAVDAAGNADATPATRQFTTDSAAPTPPARRTISGGSGSVTSSSELGMMLDWDLRDRFSRDLQKTGENGGGSPVVFQWTPSAAGVATFHTTGTGFDTILGAFAPAGVNGEMRRAAGNDDAAPGVRTSNISFRVKAGTTYLVVVDGFGDGYQAPSGPVKLAWSTATGADTAPPETVIDSGPPARGTERLSAEFHSSEPGSSFQCRTLLGGYVQKDWHPCESPYRGHVPYGAATLAVRATDAAGNTDATAAVWRWTALEPPLPEITNGPPDTTTARSATFTFTSAPAAARFECRLDDGAWAPCASPHTVSGLSLGLHEFAVRAFDEHGRRDEWHAGDTWTVVSGQVPAAPAGWSGGAARVKADFDGDGREDLAIGIPGEDRDALRDAGAVQILRGTATGLTATGGRYLTRDDDVIEGWALAGEHFGASLAAGDFDGDGLADLAIGAPGQNHSHDITDSGAVHVLYGRHGDSTTEERAQELTQATQGVADDPERSDGFGAALAAGDPDGDGDDDLAIGVAAEDAGPLAGAGAVHLVRGAPETGLAAAGAQFFTQASTGIADDPEPGDTFGGVLAFGRLNGDARADLAIGAPREDVGALRDAGAVHVLPGASAGVTGTASRRWTQDSSGIADAAEPYDRFGSVLATGRLDAAAGDDLAIGAPQEDDGAIRDTGAVHVLPGTASGETATGSTLLSQSTEGIADDPEAGDEFGAALAAAALGATAARDELVVGVPLEDLGTLGDAGAFHVLPGAGAAGSSYWTQDTAGVGDTAETGDRFGAALAAGDWRGTARADLAVAAPGETLNGAVGAGALNVFPGSASGVTAGAGRVWSQASAGVPDDPETGDGFGAGLGR